jgi:hypothetical protein
LKLEPLNNRELEFAENVQRIVSFLLIPVPVFIFSPAELDLQNQKKALTVIASLLQDPWFVSHTSEALRIDCERLKTIMLAASSFELWKRSALMYFQWGLQIVAFCILWCILWK